MSIDACFLSALCRELEPAVVGARIDKVRQPGRDEILLSLWTRSGERTLLLAAGSRYARVHLTEARYETQQTPPMFCMLLRKHLVGARITSLVQPEGERILSFGLDSPGDLGISEPKKLILELIGRYTNLILVDSGGVVIDCLNRKSGDITSERPVMSGVLYRLPKPTGKRPLSALSREGAAALLQGAPDRPLDRLLLDIFSGVSPLLCRELAFRGCGDIDIPAGEALARDGGAGLAEAVTELAGIVSCGEVSPTLLLSPGGTPVDFSFLPIRHFAGLSVPMDSLSALLDRFYTERSRADRMNHRSQDAVRTAKNLRDRTARRIEKQKAELQEATARQTLREQADIIMANLHQIHSGMTLLRSEDFYHGGKIEIPLDPKKSPHANAAALYKEYSKRKTAEKVLTERIASGEAELEYLESVLEALTLAETESDVADIRAELTSSGYLKSGAGKKAVKPQAAPMRFLSDAGEEILAGKNNTQNDRLTFGSDRRSTWLHAKGAHGSHVVIPFQGREPDPRTVSQAASIAAWYSGARNAGRVSVDITTLKCVRRNPNGRPGMVFYTDYQTVLVPPDGELAARLSRSKPTRL